MARHGRINFEATLSIFFVSPVAMVCCCFLCGHFFSYFVFWQFPTCNMLQWSHKPNPKTFPGTPEKNKSGKKCFFAWIHFHFLFTFVQNSPTSIIRKRYYVLKHNYKEKQKINDVFEFWMLKNLCILVLPFKYNHDSHYIWIFIG